MMNKDLNISIYEVIDNNERIRVYEIDGGWHSAIYLDKNKRNELVFPYLKEAANIFDKGSYKNILMLGGGMFSFAKYVLSHNMDSIVDAVEIDEMSINTAKEYFYLDEFEEEYQIKGTDRFNIYIDDARNYISYTNKIYDFIFNDTYLGTNVVSSLVTKKYLKETKRLMHDKSVYIANLPGKRNIKKSYLLMDTIKSLNSLFNHVYLIGARGHLASDTLMNYIVVASDSELDIDNDIDYNQG